MLGVIGTVDRVDEHLGVQCVIVVFDLWHLGTRWTDRFKRSELCLRDADDAESERRAWRLPMTRVGPIPITPRSDGNHRRM